MNSDLLDILSSSNKDIDNQKLMDYVSGKLSPEESHEMEKLMAENEFLEDAVEGLSSIREKRNLPAYVDQLNQTLRNQLNKHKSNRQDRPAFQFSWIYLSIALILALCIVSYFIIKLYIH